MQEKIAEAAAAKIDVVLVKEVESYTTVQDEEVESRLSMK
jgi:hypothetical protein